MSLKTITIGDVSTLKKFHAGGGEGTIFFGDKGKLIKLCDIDTNHQLEATDVRLRKLAADGLYDGLSAFCAVPEVLIEQSGTHKIVGFQMNHFQGFNPLSSVLLSKEFCISNKITIRKTATLFLALHDAINKIHSKGFIIGDLNYNNILFRFENKTIRFAFVDIDSWAVKKNGINLPATSVTPTLCHPEVEENVMNIQKHHDWYSFAVLLARSLIKDDPFNLGVLDTSVMRAIKGERQKNGITCWDPKVTLRKEDAMYVKRFGVELIKELEKWLKGDQKGIFPKSVIEKFLDGLTMCAGSLKGRKCVLEVHVDHVHCTRCGEKLERPIPRANHSQANKQQISDKELLDFLCK